jgi:hypothetical protein
MINELEEEKEHESNIISGELEYMKQPTLAELEAKCKACYVRCESTREIMNCETCLLRDMIREKCGD